MQPKKEEVSTGTTGESGKPDDDDGWETDSD